MKNFYLISNAFKDEGFVLRDRVRNYLTAHGAVCLVGDSNDKPPAETECVITLGGDGTLLRVVRLYSDLKVSFIGINTGTLGYLTEGDRDNLFDVLDALLEDRVIRERRMMIFGRVLRNGKVIARHRALNDIVVGRINTLKIVTTRVSVNGLFLKQYQSDGLIVATPTGSTAYNFSAGGPIVEPTARLFVLTPLAAHSLNNRSLVLSASDSLGIELAEASAGNTGDTAYRVYFDGDKAVEIFPGDTVEIAQASTYITILKLSERSFVETLRSKMSD